MSFSIFYLCLVILLNQQKQAVSDTLVSKLLQSPERIDSSSTFVNKAELVFCNNSTHCFRVPEFAVVLESLTCQNQLLEIRISVQYTNGTKAEFGAFINKNNALLTNKQLVTSNCLLIKRFFVSKEVTVACINDICMRTPSSQVDHVIILELLKQLRIGTLMMWLFGYYNEESSSIYFLAVLKVI